MPKKLVLVPVNRASLAAKRLAGVLSEKLDYKVWRTSAARIGRRIAYRFQAGTDKLTQLTKFRENTVSCPDYTTDPQLARDWATNGTLVVARKLLRASEGRGIVLAETADSVPEAPLYTKYIKKKKEFRVHVFNGQVIDVQEKRKRSGFTEARDTRIRNLANGYTFCRDNIVEPTGLRELAIAATAALNYTLGAVDIVYNEHSDTLYVLEVNATPGMEGTTITRYADAIIAWYNPQR